MRTITTFILLFILFLCSLFLTKFSKDAVTIKNPILNVNVNTMMSDYQKLLPDIEKYRLGTPRFYSTEKYPRQNPPPPTAFITEFPQPIYGIAYGDYPSTLNNSNLMYGQFGEGCKNNCINTEDNYYSDLLNL